MSADKDSAFEKALRRVELKGWNAQISQDLREQGRKAAAYDRLVAWLDYLEGVGVTGRFIATREIREVLEAPDAR